MGMYDLKAKLLKILDFIEDKEDIVFVDYPLHHNVGDLLILLGTIKFFKNNSLNVKAHLSTYNTDIKLLKKQITPKTTILCHGGGNFGDIYPTHQKLREDIVEHFPKNKIIILPQTAFFEDNKSEELSKKIFRAHNNVIMFARDEITYNIFKEFSSNAYLMPDMAHELYGELPKSKKKKSVLYFLRDDVEKNPMQLKLQEKIKGHDCVDWSDLLTKKDHRVAYAIHKMIRLNKYLRSSKIDKTIFKLWNSHSQLLAFRMSKRFSSYEKIVTSRLHGHILSCLVDVPSSIIDNSYGKNTSYYDLWTKDLEITSVWDE
ncbi:MULTISPECIES: polysaccharide pyruvyl transferase family protein [unclassified Psychrobacter]|uniref:polysaccharide pyruvyl transferase family protein n=1 Tax=unclassified Psychrobacter TaxID=196806 RepID=UPI003FD68B79